MTDVAGTWTHWTRTWTLIYNIVNYSHVCCLTCSNSILGNENSLINQCNLRQQRRGETESESALFILGIQPENTAVISEGLCSQQQMKRSQSAAGCSRNRQTLSNEERGSRWFMSWRSQQSLFMERWALPGYAIIMHLWLKAPVFLFLFLCHFLTSQGSLFWLKSEFWFSTSPECSKTTVWIYFPLNASWVKTRTTFNRKKKQR